MNLDALLAAMKKDPYCAAEFLRIEERGWPEWPGLKEAAEAANWANGRKPD